jgi:restriction system protein
MVRAGSYGEQEQGALDNNVVTIGWTEFPDLRQYKTREDLAKEYSRLFPDANRGKVANHVGQIWRFVHDIQKGDLVGLPLHMQSAIAIGKIESEYEFKTITPNIQHIRRVKWLKTIPRSSFDQNILYSFGAFMTVCKIERENAENKVKKLLQLKEVGSNQITPVEEIEEEEIDIEEYAKDQVIKHIGTKFKGHNLARLVDAILKAQGYNTTVSPPGPDGGVDILAAAGPLGFSSPKVCVQVKSASSSIDVRVMRELQGVMARVKADQGLLVSWGGFTNQAMQEARDSFFSLRLWDQGALLEEVFKYYDKFDDELKTELPLKRIWGLVSEE